MDTDSQTKQGLHPESRTQIKGGGANISIGLAGNVLVGNNSTIVVSKAKRNASQTKQKVPCRKPLTKSQQPLSVDQKLDIKDNVGGDWKDLGRRLGFSDPELEQLEMENSNNYSEVIYQILSRWEQRAVHRSTQEALALVFLKMGRGDLADLLSDSVVS